MNPSVLVVPFSFFYVKLKYYEESPFIRIESCFLFVFEYKIMLYLPKVGD
jgi:hypothetical protein